MKLLHEILYKILKYVESHEEAGPYTPPDFENYSRDQINYHIRICVEAEWLIKGQCRYTYGRNKYNNYSEIGELTWKGHQEIERMCNGN